MANDFTSNITQKLIRVFLEKFESARVLSKNVNTQLLKGVFDPSSGDEVNFKRPTDYVTQRTSDGDISGTTASPIITGKAKGTVQDYFTVEVDFFEADQAIKMDQLDQLLDPMATRIVTDFEVDFANFMMLNAGLLSGTPGTALATWGDVANAGAVLDTTGVPRDQMWNFAMNPFTQKVLVEVQRTLGSGGVSGKLVDEAHKRAIISENFAGMRVLSANTLASFSTAAGADRAGTLSGNPTVTYVAAKDTMTQVLAVTAFQANLVVKAGEVIQIAGRNRLNLSTRKPIIDAAAANILFTGVVTADVTLGASGEGNLVITGPALFETGSGLGAFNTTETAAVSGDVVTLLGSASELRQPNLFWHPQAYSVGSVPIEKLFSTDTIATTEDGLQIRVSKGASIRENKQIVRFDFRPAFAALNPFFAGQSWG